jgi:transposase
MEFDLKNLPKDINILHQLVQEMASVIKDHDGQIAHFKAMIQQLQRARFGRRSEQLNADQLQLDLHDFNTEKLVEPNIEVQSNDTVYTKPIGRRALPDELPRDHIILDIADKICPDCAGPLHKVGETTSEMLDWIPAKLRVKKTCRPKYACRICTTIQQIPAPERLAGMATPALLTQVLISKYCDHTPLYRQSQIFQRHNVRISRSTLAGWVGKACWWLDIIHQRLSQNIFASNHLFADDTTIPMLDPGRGRTQTGRFWVYTRDQTPWRGTEPPSAVYIFEPDRKAIRPKTHLKNYNGILHVDGYVGFESLSGKNTIKLAACWAHTRRKFYEVEKATGSPIAAEALRRIGRIYAVDAKIRGMSKTKRRAVRRVRAKPIVIALHNWLQQMLHKQFDRQSGLANAIRYTLNRWKALTRFLNDGAIELDTNSVERAIRPVTLGRKNHLFAGSQEGGKRWAIICSLIETAKMNGVEPYAYIHDILQRMLDGHPVTRLDELLPWNWEPQNPVNL